MLIKVRVWDRIRARVRHRVRVELISEKHWGA